MSQDRSGSKGGPKGGSSSGNSRSGESNSGNSKPGNYKRGNGNSADKHSGGNIRREIPGLPARQLAVALLAGVLDDKRPFDHLLEQIVLSKPWRDLSQQDRAFVRALAATTLRHLGQIDNALARLMDKPLPARAVMVQRILQLGAAQLLFMDVPDHAAVSLAMSMVEADVATVAWKGLTNGVLRNLARQREDILAKQNPGVLNTPGWLREHWIAAYGEEAADRIAAQHMVEPALDVTVGSDPAGWAEKLGGIVLPTGSVRLTPSGPVDQLAGFPEGAWWVQDAAAALPAKLLGNVAGKSVADLCAAPGGKTAMLATAGANVTAVDVSDTRLKRLIANMERLNLAGSVTTITADLDEWTPDAPFDAVLLDAPCSATGTVRRHPDVPWLKTPEAIKELATLQKQLLGRAHLWVKPGGMLVYCTCSLEPEEGEAQIAAFLARDKRFERLPITAAEIGGLEAAITPDGDMRTLPFMITAEEPRLSGIDGFFASRLVRKAD